MVGSGVPASYKTTINSVWSTMIPITGDIVRYRSKRGLLDIRAAIVTADSRTLDVLHLDSDRHVHLWVFTTGEVGGYAERNVPPGDGPGEWSRQPTARPAG